ncbi:MAG: AGE family epimerase/isomerase [Opitutaceae bacterium]|nr:AGE family epimerase/isomerase [Cytophagales bacterium]
MNKLDFPFSDLIAGTIVAVNFPDEFDSQGYITLETEDSRQFDVKVTYACYAEVLRNLGEPFQVAPNMKDILEVGRLVHAYGVFYPETSGLKFEAKHMLLFGIGKDQLRFEDQDWWIRQVQQLLNFYLDVEFQLAEGETIDFRNYRTTLSSEGKKVDGVQNLDTISRLVYGFATAYMMTGDERALEAAEKGCEYIQKHFRHRNTTEGYCYWYSEIDIQPDGSMRKLIGSGAGGNEGGNAMPCYEQIYVLAGLTQTYRISANPELLKDIKDTITFMNRYFKDHGPQGGYYSHVDPVTLSPHEETLGINKARKNWNSIGDHAPAYLINLYLATGEEEYADFLENTFDLICQHFPDYGYSPFMNEKFYDDWSRDLVWGIHQGRCVVGHNLKVAWNLTRMQSLRPKDSYKEFAYKIADIIPTAGADNQRGGWHDMMERTLKDGEEKYRLVWHDRKAWWQQEQGILAYYIMAGVYNHNPDYLKHARMGSAFYNGWFLDYELGGIYFNVLANGQPYALGSERGKGSHSMAGYHSFELCFLSAVYTNLLVNKQPMNFHFSPNPSGLKDRILRVSPDLLPAGSVVLEEVTVDGLPYENFDSDKLTITLPDVNEQVKVIVRMTPKKEAFDVELLSNKEGKASYKLFGDLDRNTVNQLRNELDKLTGITRIELDMKHIKTVSDEGWNYFAFARQMRGDNFTMEFSNLSKEVKVTLDESELAEEFEIN